MTDNRDPVERMRRNRPIVIGISLGVLTTFLLMPEVEGILRYAYLLVGGAIGAGLGWLVVQILERRSKP
jgi:hypothetical protein